MTRQTNDLSSRLKLIAVVVTYNRLAKLKLTISHLLENAPHALDTIVVVNNASTDGTAEWLDTVTDPRVDVMTSTRNLGGAGGFEKGLRRAFGHHHADWAVVMDDDAWAEVGAFESFVTSAPDENTAVAAAVYYPDGRICEMNRPSENPFWHPRIFLRTLVKGRDGYHIPHDAYSAPTPHPIDLTSFVGLFISRQMVEVAGYPDPGLFIYGDDVIYTLGLRKQGFKINFDPALRFVHDCTTFTPGQKKTYTPLWKVYYAYRNGLMMYRRAGGIMFWALLPLLLIQWKRVANRYGDNRDKYERLRKIGIRDGLRRCSKRSHAEVLEIMNGRDAG
ncbi:glycosyltransferase [Aliiroseovarius marinus]|uniref:glycosyltransferase n=1 Tax=Aliiroseovarius marinus TaxID=2500159 RepID=UPI003D7E9DC9